MFVLAVFTVRAAERINHEGRLLGPVPVVTNAIVFNTPESDVVVSALQIFPRNNAWNEDISRRLALSNSAPMVAMINSELFAGGANRTNLHAFQEMNFVLVPDDQPPRPITFNLYGDESDPSPYPIPTNMPVEGWPSQTGNLSLYNWQRDINNTGGDRHSIIIQPGTGYIWETWLTKLVVTASASNWTAANGAKFNINSNSLRPLGWTSGDAAGLAMLGGLVRYDECQRGAVEHAVRLIVKHTRREYIYPATHHASSPSTTNPNVPAMGQRLRLRANFVPPASWSTPEKAIVRALQKYGGIVADNGNFLSFSVVPDQRWASGQFNNLLTLAVKDFEIIQTTAANEGPRSPGAPLVDAGADRNVGRGEAVTLQGEVHYNGTPPLIVNWRVYSGPSAAVFSNTNATNASVTFNSNGVYTLMLRADDGVHTPAYDAVVFTVGESIRALIERNGTNAALRWTGGVPPYLIESATVLPSSNWIPLGTFSTNAATVTLDSNAMFFRVRGQ
ncbi:MAG TPA: hypothetical protein VK530_11130 [Candidatus Acidoferrum sp.]|nr:hypothetical protein [Candidatus Acidoferrum sp.]